MAYTDGEWERLENACRTVIDASRRRQRELLNLAASGQDPRVSRRHSEADIAWLMLRDGPLAGHAYCSYVRGYVRKHPDASYAAVRSVRESLFPTPRVQIAYRLLFGLLSGVVPDGIDDLEVGDIEWAGEATILLAYYKGRNRPGGRRPAPAGRSAAGAVARARRPATDLRPAGAAGGAVDPGRAARHERNRRPPADPQAAAGLHP
ncbi:hypothetical protein ACWDSL_08620 [Streptomyces sp. NPDC000941]